MRLKTDADTAVETRFLSSRIDLVCFLIIVERSLADLFWVIASSTNDEISLGNKHNKPYYNIS